MNPYLKEGNTQFDHLDLMKYLLRRIIWILLAGVICAGAAWALQKYRIKKASDVKSEEPVETIDQKVELINATYWRSLEQLSEHREYLMTAPYMNLDPDHVWRDRAVVWVESGSPEYSADQLEELYRNDLSNEDYLQELAQERGTEACYLKELIDSWDMTVEDSTDYDINDATLAGKKQDDKASSELFCIQSVGGTKEEAQELMEALLEELQVLNQKYEKEYPHELKVLSRTCTEAVAPEVRNTQREQIAYSQSLLEALKDLELKGQRWNPSTEPEAANKRPRSPKKMGLIGFAAGFFLACVWFTWRYLKNDKLVDYKDIRRQGLCLKELGTISDHGTAMAAANIRNFAKERKKLFLTGMSSQAEFDNICKELKEYLSEYEIVCDRDVVHDPKSKEELVACDAAVMVEQKGVTRYSEMKEEVTFLFHAGKEIVGIVIL